jgi:hypothetical protein
LECATVVYRLDKYSVVYRVVWQQFNYGISLTDGQF